MLDLWIVRHGETDWNLEGRIQGWTDVPLNAQGMRQAFQLAHHIEGIPFRTVYSSDLQRAAKTASILGAHLCAPQLVHPALRERRFGLGEGLFREEMNLRFPGGVPDAETEQEVLTRIQSFLQDVTSAFPCGRVLCVTHGATIRLLLRYVQVTEVPPLRNTGVSRIRWDGKRWRLIGVNWTLHLHNAENVIETDPVALGFCSAESSLRTRAHTPLQIHSDRFFTSQ